MQRLIIILSGMLIILFSVPPLYAGVITEVTRVIYQGNKKEASLTVSNQGTQAEPFLIQSWVDNNGPDKIIIRRCIYPSHISVNKNKRHPRLNLWHPCQFKEIIFDSYY
ncbi:fimbria/pilus periplasmic chaperone [Rahnella bonaserana]|uniref:fimbrial biogenesis chaperone n=1 Tax=Rahnella bonaserana TaxID=2816248 RepID=UPI0024C22CBB|nr:fimbria/pilus periplasmic chaperone [Rahnella bonaserana]WHZ40046.1 fimbria/pilus periplasmic chaperone [Rahnella bonaserana]